MNEAILFYLVIHVCLHLENSKTHHKFYYLCFIQYDNISLSYLILSHEMRLYH